MTRNSLLLTASLASAMLLGACESGFREGPPSNIALEGTPLDRHSIGVEPSTEVLEIDLDGNFSTLRLEDRRRIEAFVNAYRDRGFGDLRMVLPENSSTPELAIEAVKEAREIAWTRGVSWEAIDGAAYDAQGTNAPMVLAFDVYNAVAPDCKSLAAYDYSNFTSNNELENFGCTIKYNIAQMIADPADLLGQRTLDRRDNGRLSLIMEAYRAGEDTAAETGEEAVSVSGVGG